MDEVSDRFSHYIKLAFHLSPWCICPTREINLPNETNYANTPLADADAGASSASASALFPSSTIRISF